MCSFTSHTAASCYITDQREDGVAVIGLVLRRLCLMMLSIDLSSAGSGVLVSALLSSYCLVHLHRFTGLW